MVCRVHFFFRVTNFRSTATSKINAIRNPEIFTHTMSWKTARILHDTRQHPGGFRALSPEPHLGRGVESLGWVELCPKESLLSLLKT